MHFPPLSTPAAKASSAALNAKSRLFFNGGGGGGGGGFFFLGLVLGVLVFCKAEMGFFYTI